MGQRSQIYIAIKDADCGHSETVGSGEYRFSRHVSDIQSDLVVANYYQWNYGERMVSRARGVMEWLQCYKEKNYLHFLMDNNVGGYKEKLSRIADTNFDMRDVAISSNILKEIEEYAEWEQKNNPDFKATPEYFRDVVFDGQDNNDGQLYLQVTPTEIKYAFTDYEADSMPMTAREYLDWDGCDGSSLDEEDRKIMENNISFINENATLMTKEELEAFKNYDFPVKQKFLEKYGNAEISSEVQKGVKNKYFEEPTLYKGFSNFAIG